jgi:hypothetical protein
MKAEDIYKKLKEITFPIHAWDDQMSAIARWIEAEFERKSQNPILSVNGDIKRCIWTELENMGYDEHHIDQLFIFMEKLPIHYLSDKAKEIKVMVAKGHILAI